LVNRVVPDHLQQVAATPSKAEQVSLMLTARLRMDTCIVLSRMPPRSNPQRVVAPANRPSKFLADVDPYLATCRG
jgi:hypothetical protein